MNNRLTYILSICTMILVIASVKYFGKITYTINLIKDCSHIALGWGYIINSIEIDKAGNVSNYKCVRPNTGKYVFDCWSMNYAFGSISINGFYIDKDGDVFTYKRSGINASTTTHSSDNGSFAIITEDELDAKYQNSNKVGKIVATVLQEKINLIIPSSRGKIERRGGYQIADGGQSFSNALLYNAGTGKYVAIDLGSIGHGGNYDSINTSKESGVLRLWLQDVASGNYSTTLSSPASTDNWICPRCTGENTDQLQECEHCGCTRES